MTSTVGVGRSDRDLDVESVPVRSRVVAHRGASAACAPGNTLAAFRAAATLGADCVELDVRPTADGHLAVHHDAELPDGRSIASLTSSALPAWVPSLDASLDACAGMGVNIEVKADCPAAARHGLITATIATLRERADPDRFLVTSFSWELVDRVRELAPELATGLVVPRHRSVPDPVAAATAGGHRVVNPWHSLIDEQLVVRAHAEGVHVNAWTVDDLERIVALDTMGVDAVITNAPDVARRALGTGSSLADHERRGRRFWDGRAG